MLCEEIFLEMKEFGKDAVEIQNMPDRLDFFTISLFHEEISLKHV